MNTGFNLALAAAYQSNSQRARVLSEGWVVENMFCPRCGCKQIDHFPNNRPVADFFCPECGAEFELKSKRGTLGNKIADGAYATMIERIGADNNPDFFFMSYSPRSWSVVDFIVVPRHFFVPSIIEKRKPLSPDARRAGWTGCNIEIGGIPEQGRITVISDGKVRDPGRVIADFNRSTELYIRNIDARGWLFDVLECVNRIHSDSFSLADMYTFAEFLHNKHPKNNNIHAKIRQQLQLLRDKGVIEFLGGGRYRLLIWEG